VIVEVGASSAKTGMAKAEANAATSSLFLNMMFPFYKKYRDKSIHDKLLAASVPLIPNATGNGFSKENGNYEKK
jgi:hypothetical protein